MAVINTGRLLGGRAARRTAVVDWLWSGALTANGFVVTAELLAAAASVSLVVSESPLLNPVVFQSAQTSTAALAGNGGETYHVAGFDVSGLQANRNYYFAVAVDGVLDRNKVGHIRTTPVAMTPSDFRIVVGACTNPGSSAPDSVFPAVEAV
ncbi:MAG: hypothetical protein ACTSX7_14060 [Alphaproteobacteria bacterium]